MNAPQPPLPSLAGLWGLLWRAVVFLPFALTAFVFATAVPALLFAWMITFAIIEQWWHAIACGAALASVAHFTRWLCGRKRTERVLSPEQPPGIAFL